MAQEAALERGGFGATTRSDDWWLSPLVVFLALSTFIVYSTWAAFQNAHYSFGGYLSPFYSPELFGDWPTVDEYARMHCESSNRAMLPLMIAGGPDYAAALHNGLQAIYRHKRVQEGLDDVAAQWDAITKRRGVAKQRRSYLSYLKQTGSSREMTADARGLAVKC